FPTRRSSDLNLIGQHTAKRHPRSEGGILGFRLHGKIAVDLAAPRARGYFRKLQHIGFVAKRRLQLLQKTAVPERNFGGLCMTMKHRVAAYAGTNINARKTRDESN